MDRQEYAEQLLEHYESPRHYGPLPNADVSVRGENPGCDDIITIYLTVGPQQTADQIQFEGEGCTISLGAVSVLLDMVQHKPLAEIYALDYNDLIERLGKEVVLTRVNCATLGLKTLKQAIKRYQTQSSQPVTNMESG